MNKNPLTYFKEYKNILIISFNTVTPPIPESYFLLTITQKKIK